MPCRDERLAKIVTVRNRPAQAADFSGEAIAGAHAVDHVDERRRRYGVVIGAIALQQPGAVPAFGDQQLPDAEGMQQTLAEHHLRSAAQPHHMGDAKQLLHIGRPV